MNKQESDIFIKGILTSFQTYSASNSRRTFKYQIYPIGKICRDAFVHLLSILRQLLLQNIANDMSTHFKLRIHGNKGIRLQHALSGQQKAFIKRIYIQFCRSSW